MNDIKIIFFDIDGTLIDTQIKRHSRKHARGAAAPEGAGHPHLPVDGQKSRQPATL